MKAFFFILPLFLFLGCAHAPSSVRVAMPISYEPDVALSVTLHRALQAECAGMTGSQRSLHATIIEAPSDKALVGVQGVAFARDLSMRVTVACRDEHDTVLWKETMTGRARLFMPRDHSEYLSLYAEARQKMCYDVARLLQRKLLEKSSHTELAHDQKYTC